MTRGKKYDQTQNDLEIGVNQEGESFEGIVEPIEKRFKMALKTKTVHSKLKIMGKMEINFIMLKSNTK